MKFHLNLLLLLWMISLDDKLCVILDCQDLIANVVLFNLDITVISSETFGCNFSFF